VKHNLPVKTLAKLKDAVYSEYFVDALRATLTVILPAIVFFTLGWRGPAIGTALGALLISLCDEPGDIPEKANSLTIGSIVLAAVTLVTSAALSSHVVLAMLILVCCLGFSYVSIYGSRASNTGSLALVMMIFTVGLHPEGPSFSLYIFLGGMWYVLSAVLYLKIFPFRPVRHSLSECIAEIAAFLRTKAGFYDLAVPLNDCYRAVISGHIRVSEKQDKVRTILLKESMIARQSAQTNLGLVQLASEAIDLYEQILAIHYDYEFIRKTLFDLGMLNTVNRLMKQIADELSKTALLIRRNQRPNAEPAVMERLPLLRRRLQNTRTSARGLEADLVNKIIENFEVIDKKTQSIQAILTQSGNALQEISDQDAFRFVSRPAFSLGLVREHFTVHSAIFRFSIRIAVTCFSAYLSLLYFFHGKYDYWLLLTIVIIARPGFSTTRKRNFQRFTGTAIGIGIAFTLLYFLNLQNVLIGLLPVLLLGYLSFLHKNYLVSVCFITVLAVTGMHLLGGKDNDLLLERFYYTLLGGVMVFLAAFIFPFWESRKMSALLKTMLTANIHYLHQLLNHVSGKPFDVIEYKLARKQIFVSSANLSRAYQQMLSEPKTSPLVSSSIYRFQIFNHELYASVAALLLDGVTNKQLIGSAEYRQIVEQSISFLENAVGELSSVKGSSPVFTEPLKEGRGTKYMDIAGQQLKLIRMQAQNIYIQTSKIVQEQSIL
jgi:uncharacterized membrane protein YccC